MGSIDESAGGARPRRHANGLAVIGLAAAVLSAAAASALVVLGGEGPLASLVGRAAPAARTTEPPRAEALAHYLVRSTLMTLDDANRTGNYAVLRQLASPGFQSANSTERLAEIFAGQRQQQLDLSVAALERPDWTQPPGIGSDHRLHLVGGYHAQGSRLAFALAYEASAGEWRLHAIHVTVEPEAQRDRRDRIASDRD